MNKTLGEKYLKFYISSNANEEVINRFILEENITVEEYTNIVKEYLEYLKNDSKKNINKLYLEYCLRFKNLENKTLTKRKEAEIMLNIINSYIKEDKHNIKEYVSSCNLD